MEYSSLAGTTTSGFVTRIMGEKANEASAIARNVATMFDAPTKEQRLVQPSD
jgi:hypothetical protein